MTHQLQIPTLEGTDFIKVKSYEPDEWPAPPHGVTLSIRVYTKRKFLWWSYDEWNSLYPAYRYDMRDGEDGVQETVDKLVATYSNINKARATVTQLSSN